MPKQSIPVKSKQRKRVVFEMDLKTEDVLTRKMKTVKPFTSIKSILKKKKSIKDM
jgi:hypothetical protein